MSNIGIDREQLLASAFVELAEGLEGLCHVSELSDERVAVRPLVIRALRVIRGNT